MKDMFKLIDGYKQEVINLQSALTRIPAVSPDVKGGTGELDKANYIESVLKKMKFDKVQRFNAPDKRAKGGVRPTIAAIYNGKDKSKTVWFLAHTDVVPANAKDWKTDPFKAVVKGDKIYGRGTEDNQQGLVAGLLAVKAFMDKKIRPAVNVGLIFVADEENGSLYGIQYILKKHGNIFGKKDSFVIPDFVTKGGAGIEIAEKSLLWLKVTTTGKSAHGAMPHLGKNAFEAGAYAVIKLKEGLYKKFNKKEKIFDPMYSSFEPTKQEANVENINNIPGEDIFYMDCRILPNYSVDAVLKEARAIAAGIDKKFGTKTVITELRRSVSPPTSADAPIVKCMADAIKTVLKAKPYIFGIGGGTVGAYLREKKYPCIVVGKGDSKLHGPDEYSSISSTLQETKMYAYIAANIK